MTIYAISDLHLGLALGKTMDPFGAQWLGHTEKVKLHWQQVVQAEDTVLLPGDLSWATKWSDFAPDLEFLASLPGRKVISRGNHDYYWLSKSKMRELLPPEVVPLEISHTQVATATESYVVVGVKGWLTPANPLYKEETDAKYYLRELQRLQLALEAASLLAEPLIVQMHFPPAANLAEQGFTQVLESFGVQICLYGHLHGEWHHPLQGIVRGVNYHLVSADYLNFVPKRIV